MTRRAWSAISGLLVALVLVAGCGGDGDKASADKPGAASDYSRALRAARTGDYDTALKLMGDLGGYRDARRQVARIRVVGARAKLAAARRKLETGPSPQSAIALARTSLKYHPTPEARAFLRRAQAAHVRFKRRQARGLEER